MSGIQNVIGVNIILFVYGDGSFFCPFFVGYTWQDDTTQEVISKELSHLPKVPLGRYFTGNSR